MKANKTTSKKLNKASGKALLNEVATRLSNEVLFRDKVEKAKEYLKQSTFPSRKNSLQ
ncbi:hypothetical protein [Paraflavitalea soli]|uniref:hypothetical protein n=1 Tax=Paraflavitalea soli TaxID=2315862 RepID=UPI0013C536E4|nr:hypothetical protein [Paraflavitalea soli]